MNTVMNTVALSVPTGIGAFYGGFAGDAGHIAREFSKYFKVIVNPNVVNAGVLSAINDNMYYVEGYAFDEFFSGALALKPRGEGENKIGVIIDKSVPEGVLNIHLNTLNALKIVKGYDADTVQITDEPVGVSLVKDFSGVSSGRIENEKTLFRAAESLLNKGCEALAVVCFFGDECEDEAYNEGAGVDPIGGIEAVISHCLTKEFMVPSAHSPAFSGLDIVFKKVNPKVSSEFISSTYLPCIIDGLSKAPKLVKNENAGACGGFSRDEVKCLIVPKDALGSKAVLGAIEGGVEVLGVDNKVVLSIDCKKLKEGGIIGCGTESQIKEFSSYEECLRFIRKKYEK